jgi:hypothetical protein
MQVRTFLSLLACLLLVVPVFAQQGKADSIAGSWAGTWGPNRNDRNDVTVSLKWDGKTLTGNVDSEGQIIPIQKGTYDAKTGAVHMEADAKSRGGDIVHFVIDGKFENGTMSGTWNHDTRKGDFKITKK